MAIQLQRGERDIQRIVDSIIQLVQGRQNSVGDVTLTPGVATTTVNFPNASKDSRVFLFPQTANAAAAMPTTYVLRANMMLGGFVISHANNGQADRIFNFLVIGG